MVGVDKWPQPRYCGDYFVRADVMDLIGNSDFIRQFDFVHMSPPCQMFSPTRTFKREKKHVDLLTPSLKIVRELYPDMIWVTENVPNSPMYSRLHQLLQLCASSFPGHSGFDERRLLHRHRWFRLHNFSVPKMPCRHNGYRTIGVYGSLNSEAIGGGDQVQTLKEAKKLMQIDWMLWHELKEAIPPAYMEYIASQGLIDAVLKQNDPFLDHA